MATKSQVQKKEESALRKRRLAERINDNAMLIAAIRFYLAFLLPTRAADALSVRQRCKVFRWAWKRYLKAARRVLDIRYRGRSMCLPENWGSRLGRVGLEVLDCFGIRPEFERLNADLVIDDAMRDYSACNWQVIEETKRFLCAGELPKEEPKPELSDYDKHLERHFMENVREHFGFTEEPSSNGSQDQPPGRCPIEHRNRQQRWMW